MKKRLYLFTPLFALFLLLSTTLSVSAHQPYFEDTDMTAETPWLVADPTVSIALYFTLASSQDVDYVSFTGKQGDRILLVQSGRNK